jgi:hypothetical protein
MRAGARAAVGVLVGAAALFAFHDRPEHPDERVEPVREKAAASLDAPAFWRWFAANQHRLRTSAPPPDPVLDDVLERLSAYADGLGFETSYDASPDEEPEFIVTAFGHRDLFPAADALVAAAPAGLDWKVFALKPALGFEVVHERGGREYDPKRMRFDPVRSEGRPVALGVRVYIEDYDPSRVGEQDAAVASIVDTGLGERHAAESIDFVEVAPWPSSAKAGEALPLERLPAYVEWHRRRHPDRRPVGDPDAR